MSEKDLWLAVVKRAWQDLELKSFAQDAHEFLSGTSGELKLICDHIGWNYDALLYAYTNNKLGDVFDLMEERNETI